MSYLQFSDLLRSWLESIAVQYPFFGVFFISFLGSVSIIFPIPYTLVILGLGITGSVDPLILTIAGGLGSAVGELSGYALGYYGTKLISEERRNKMRFFVKIFDKYGPIVVFLFALTPLPDDLIFIPLGILRYKFWKTFITCVAGKLLMCFLLAYFGNIFGNFLVYILGEENFWVGMTITIIALVIILLILLRIDWEKIFEKYIAKERDGGGKLESDS